MAVSVGQDAHGRESMLTDVRTTAGLAGGAFLGAMLTSGYGMLVMGTGAIVGGIIGAVLPSVSRFPKL